MKISSSTKYLFLIFLISFVFYFPSLSAFYTNDDFFHLRISQANNVGDFLNYFNLFSSAPGFPNFRPLTTQAFYFLSWKLFKLNPLGLHVISFLAFFGVIYLVYRLTKLLLSTHDSRLTTHAPLIAAFLYAISATHFGHLYFLGAFQELGMTFFFLLSVIFFINFLRTRSNFAYFVSLITFLLSLLSKETAVVLPLALVVVYWYFKTTKQTRLSLGKICVSLAPYYILLATYFYLRLVQYGFAQGESYIWDFSFRRAINTLGWYGLWSFNLPEMLVDFVGPGLKFNPNLFKFFSREIVPIFVIFSILVIFLFNFLYQKLRKVRFKLEIRNWKLEIFGMVWFVLTLLPVIFLPLHKFTYSLTLPLFGVIVPVSYLLTSNRSRLLAFSFMTCWFLLSLITLNLTRETHWITQGAQVAARVHAYLMSNKELMESYKIIVFYDSPEDEELPWRPSELLKVVLSDQNYFKVFWNDKLTARYYNSENEIRESNAIEIKARKFLNY